jgi:3-hydroxybutyryl-CoA dehydratase
VTIGLLAALRQSKYIALQYRLLHHGISAVASLEKTGGEGTGPMEDVGGYYLEDLSEGMSAVYTKTVTDQDLALFADVSGDFNPVHMDAEYAKTTMFKGRIAHGMLSASFISTVLGTKLPGPGCVYLSQNLKFKAPVRPGDTVTAQVTVKAVDQERGRVSVETVCTVDGKPVIDGEAVLLVPRKPVARAAE